MNDKEKETDEPRALPIQKEKKVLKLIRKNIRNLNLKTGVRAGSIDTTSDPTG